MYACLLDVYILLCMYIEYYCTTNAATTTTTTSLYYIRIESTSSVI